MSKLVQNDIVSLTNEQSALAALNSNYATLEAFSDTVLSRDGTTPNQMGADLDMNGNQILNLSQPQTSTEPLRLQDLQDFVGGTLVISPLSDGDRGDITVSSGGLVWSVDPNAISNTKLEDMAQATFKMRAAGAGTGDPIDGTASQAKTALALVVADVSGAAPIASPTFTGVPAAPTATPGTNTTQIATTAFVLANGGGPLVFTPEGYGAIGDGTTDDTTAFQNMATAVRTAVSAVVELGKNKSYSVFPSPSVGTSTLLDFTGCEGLRVNFNGSKLVSPGTYTGGRVVRVITLQNCYDVEINGYWAEQTTTTTADVSNGLSGIYLIDTNRDIRVNSFYQKYGRACLECLRTSELSLTNRARDIRINGMIADGVEYGPTFQKNGDQVTIRGLKGINTARTLDAYNVRQLDVVAESEPGTNTLNDILVGVYTANAESALSNTLSDVKIRYVCRTQTDNCSGLTGLFVQQGDASSTAGFMRNISFDLDIEIGTSTNTSTAFEIFKQGTGASNDTTTRNHVLENLRVSGSLKSFANNIDLIKIGQAGTWSGETVRNIVFENLTSTGSGTGKFIMNTLGFLTTQFKGVRFAHDLSWSNDSGYIDFDWDCSFTNNSSFTQLGTSGKFKQSTGAGQAFVYTNIGATKSSFSAHKNGTDQTSFPDATFTQVTFGTEAFDVGSNFASNTWTPPAGKVCMMAAVTATGTITLGNFIGIAIYKNGASYKKGVYPCATNQGNANITAIDDANGTDAYTVQCYLDVTSGTGTISGAADSTYFMGYMI
jgi:hypothetical protein